MFISCEGADAPTGSSANLPVHPSTNPPTNPPTDGPTVASSECEPVRHLLFGTPPTVQATIHHLYRLNYAEPNDWSQPISTGRANEVMAILTKRVRVSS
ncbi:MAG: hypothetical protein WBC73_14990 [Phormidesmis sp.]